MALSEQVFDDNKKFLWGVCYRMTGNAADAEDLVQETFARALEKPPADTQRPLRGWLVQVAINLSRDLMRRRRRREYTGPWLPSPIPTDEEEVEESTVAEEESPAARYDLLESVSMAFLLALEALTPSQRAALLILMGFPLKAVVAASGIFIAWAMLNHSNLKIDLRFLESILITPRLHRIRHLYKTSERNLGTVFTFWDRIRGTLVLVDTDESNVFSNGDVKYPQSWVAQLIEPIRRISRLRRVSHS